MTISAYIRLAEEIEINPTRLETEILQARACVSKNSDLLERFTLMSRFYTRSLEYDPSEEKFMMLWTSLEIHPMHNTSNIKPLRELISQIVGRPDKVVNEAIGIGRLYGIRSSLVHDGHLDKNQYKDVFGRLETLVHEVLRSMIGLPYSGALEKYFEQ